MMRKGVAFGTKRGQYKKSTKSNNAEGSILAIRKC